MIPNFDQVVIAGVEQRCSIYKIENGWLVSHAPKPIKHEEPSPEEIEAARKAARNHEKEEAKKVLLLGAAAAKFAQGEEWNAPDIDEAVSQIIPRDPPPPTLAAYYPAYSPQARAFATLREALDYLATVLE